MPRDLVAPSRPRDFRLTTEDAERLRGSAVTRLLHRLGGPGLKVLQPLAGAAMAIGIDGLFCEVHPDPDHAPSDGPNMLRLDEFRGFLQRLLAIRSTVESFS